MLDDNSKVEFQSGEAPQIRNHENSSQFVTKRDSLAQNVRGAVLASVAPYLSRTQMLLAQDSSAPRARDSFDLGWEFLDGDAPGAQSPKFSDADWCDVDLPHD
jgi:hypothetical protein